MKGAGFLGFCWAGGKGKMSVLVGRAKKLDLTNAADEAVDFTFQGFGLLVSIR
jgi:hypothetical protein